MLRADGGQIPPSRSPGGLGHCHSPGRGFRALGLHIQAAFFTRSFTRSMENLSSVFPIEMNFLPSGKRSFLTSWPGRRPSTPPVSHKVRAGLAARLPAPALADFFLGFYRFLLPLLSIRRQQRLTHTRRSCTHKGQSGLPCFLKRATLVDVLPAKHPPEEGADNSGPTPLRWGSRIPRT